MACLVISPPFAQSKTKLEGGPVQQLTCALAHSSEPRLALGRHPNYLPPSTLASLKRNEISNGNTSRHPGRLAARPGDGRERRRKQRRSHSLAGERARRGHPKSAPLSPASAHPTPTKYSQRTISESGVLSSFLPL